MKALLGFMSNPAEPLDASVIHLILGAKRTAVLLQTVVSPLRQTTILTFDSLAMPSYQRFQNLVGTQ